MRNGRGDRFGTALALAHGFLLRDGELLALDSVIAENDDGARHRAALVLRVDRWNINAAVAGGELAHGAPEPPERPGDAAADQPVGHKAEQDHAEADAENEQLGLLLRFSDAVGCCCRLTRRR